MDPSYLSTVKILFIMDSLGTGGAERSTADLWYFLRESGVEVKIFILSRRKEGIEVEIQKAGFNVVFLKAGNLFSQGRAIAAQVRAFQPDIVHSVLFKSNLRTRFARLTARFIHIESLVNCTYDPIRLKDPNIGKAAFYFYKYLDKFTSSLVDHFHSITETVKKHYIEVLGIREKKITVVYRGRDLPLPGTLSRQDIGLDVRDFMIINTGRHEFQKGQLFLVKAIGELFKQGYSTIRLMILGREGNATHDIRQFIEVNGLADRVILGGYRSDVGQVLQLGDLFAFPSLYEGLGGALIEAQAAGLPIVCNDLPVLKEVVLENENAKIFSSEDIKSIVKAILFFYDQREQRTLFGKRSLENFEQKFNLSTIHQKMLQLYQKLCSA